MDSENREMDSELLAALKEEFRHYLAHELRAVCLSRGNGWSEEAVCVATQLLQDRSRAGILELEDDRISRERKAGEDSAAAHANEFGSTVVKLILGAAVIAVAIGLGFAKHVHKMAGGAGAREQREEDLRHLFKGEGRIHVEREPRMPKAWEPVPAENAGKPEK
jgi:hypothetical protein